MMSFDSATVTSHFLDEKTASSFPGTILMVAEANGNMAVVFNSLPLTVSDFTDDYNAFQHGNVTMLEVDGQTYGIMPKHMFGKDIDLREALRSQNFNIVKNNSDIVSIRLKKKQATLTAEPFEKLEPEKLDGAPCTVRTLNYFKGEPGIREYLIQGTLHYISPTFQKANAVNTVNMFGKKTEGVPTDGMYVVRVPNVFFWDILGMSGGSATVTVDGKERFLGTNNFRFTPIITGGKDTTVMVMLAIQPVLKKDLSEDQVYEAKIE